MSEDQPVELTEEMVVEDTVSEEKTDRKAELMPPYSKEFDDICREFIDAVIGQGTQVFNSGFINADTAIQVILWTEPRMNQEAALRYGANVPMDKAAHIVYNLGENLLKALEEQENQLDG